MWHWSFHCNSEVARELVSSCREASGGGVGCRNANARQSNQPPDCHFRIIDRGWAGSGWIQISALPRFSCWYGDATYVTTFSIAPTFQGNGYPTRGKNGSSSNTDFIKGPWFHKGPLRCIYFSVSIWASKCLWKLLCLSLWARPPSQQNGGNIYLLQNCCEDCKALGQSLAIPEIASVEELWPGNSFCDRDVQVYLVREAAQICVQVCSASKIPFWPPLVQFSPNL